MEIRAVVFRVAVAAELRAALAHGLMRSRLVSYPACPIRNRLISRTEYFFWTGSRDLTNKYFLSQ